MVLGIVNLVLLVLLTGMFAYFLKVFNKNNVKVKDCVDGVQKTLVNHIRDEEGAFSAVTKTLVGLVNQTNTLHGKVEEFSAALAAAFIKKADVYEEEWAEVKERLFATADEAFNGALAACGNCVGKCGFVDRFLEIVAKRRAESFRIWEVEAIPQAVLKVVEQIDKELYPRVIDIYLPDILSICVDRRAGLEKRKALVQEKVLKYKEQVKMDWEEAILKRLHFQDAPKL